MPRLDRGLLGQKFEVQPAVAETEKPGAEAAAEEAKDTVAAAAAKEGDANGAAGAGTKTDGLLQVKAPGEAKASSRPLSQTSGASKKRTAADLKMSQQALEPVGEKAAEDGPEDEKRAKAQ